jgi:hypothetical protein
MSWQSYDETMACRWDEFVSGHPDGRMPHLSGFKRAVEETYGFESFYRAYVRGGELRAVFPGFFHRSRLYGRKIVSQPFNEYGGILFAVDANPDERHLLLSEFERIALRALRIKRFDSLEMRHPADMPGGEARFQAVPLFQRAVRTLDAPDILWAGLASKDRNIIRKAQEFGLTFTEDHSEETLRTRFYPLYLKTMKRLGTPPHPLAFFLRLSRYLAPNLKLFMVSFRRVSVASLVAWAVGRTVHVTDMCSDDAAFFLRPNDFAVWTFLGWAYDQGYKIFDFGPVRYRGQEIFKKKWNMEMGEYRYVYLSAGLSRPKNPYSEPGAVMTLAPGLWKALVPVGVGRFVGKYLRREVGL